MKLFHPFKIGSRLLPALQVGDGWLSMESIGCQNNRLVYRWYIDIPAGEFSEADISSPRDNLQEVFGTLLAFLVAAAESHTYGMRKGEYSENHDLFPLPVVEWAYQHSDELDILKYEIEENQSLIQEDD